MTLADYYERTTFNNNHRCRITKPYGVWKIECTCGITRFKPSHEEAIKTASNHIIVWSIYWDSTDNKYKYKYKIER